MSHWRLISLVVLCAAVASPAMASVVFNLDTPFPTDPAPDGPAPWLTATFTTVGPDTVTLTMQANLTNDNFVGGQTGFGWGFNFSGDPSGLGFAFVSG